MKLYNSMISPNARRIRVYLAEKGLSLETVDVDLPNDGARTPDFLALNSLGAVPVLVLDDGSVITESVAICRYLDALHPQPPLFGTEPVSTGRVEMWLRRLEFEIMLPLANAVQHTHPFFASRIEQLPAYAETQRRLAEKKFRWLDGEIGTRPYIAGDSYSMADIVGLCAVGVAEFAGLAPDPGLERLHGWIGRISARPSADA